MEVVGVYLLKMVAVAIVYIEKEGIICVYILLKHGYLLNPENCLYTIKRWLFDSQKLLI